MIHFKIVKLDKRFSGNNFFNFRAESLYFTDFNKNSESTRLFVEARNFLWQNLGASAELDELHSAYKNQLQRWCWRGSNNYAGKSLYLKDTSELSLFLLKYAEYTTVDNKIKML